MFRARLFSVWLCFLALYIKVSVRKPDGSKSANFAA